MKLKALFILVFALGISQLTQAQELFSGDFKADSYFITFEGSWDIIKSGDTYKVRFKDNFDAKKAPDLKIYLSKLDFDDVDAKNASNESTSAFVAELKNYEGKMEFEIPKGINPNDYKSIIVNCKKYSKFWGGSNLK